MSSDLNFDLITGPRAHQIIFFLVNGTGPWSCHFCGEEINETGKRLGGRSLIVHHVDWDHSNNDPENLVATHWGCHTRHHVQGSKHSEETKSNMRATWTEERRKRFGLLHKDPKPASTIEAMRKTAQARPFLKCETCGRVIQGNGPLAVHKLTHLANNPLTGKFPDEDARRKMREAHARAPWFTCSVCGREIHGRGSFVLHERACQKKPSKKVRT